MSPFDSTQNPPAAKKVATTLPIQLPKPTDVDEAQIRSVAAQLRRLTDDPDPGVRGESLCALAMWDRSAQLEAFLRRGLRDSLTAVRQAAISAVGYSSIRSAELKKLLQDLALAAEEDVSVRIRAVALLTGDFALSDNEQTELSNARLQINALLAARFRAQAK